MAGIMSPHHKEIIDVELRREFIRELCLDEEFYSVMRKDHCITEDIMEQVKIKVTLNGRQEGVSEFLTRLKMRPERAFKQFVRALIETHQDHLALLVDRELEKRGEQAMSPHIMDPPAANYTDQVDRISLLQEITNIVADEKLDLSTLTIKPMPANINKSRIDRKACYGDTAQQSGRVIIINNEHFQEQNHAWRQGSEKDVNNLTKLFTKFNFEVKTKDNESAKRMKEILSEESRDASLKNIDILIVILMSHGSNNVVVGSDGNPVHIHPDITAFFSNENCPLMAGKPKLFIIQACQIEPKGPVSVPDFQNPDTYIAMAAVAGDAAFRVPVSGSLFIRAIVCAISKCSHNMDIRDMIALASDAVRKTKNMIRVKDKAEKEERIQLPKAIDTLSKECYLIHPDSTVR